jgi:hypothetical protein
VYLGYWIVKRVMAISIRYESQVPCEHSDGKLEHSDSGYKDT